MFNVLFRCGLLIESKNRNHDEKSHLENFFLHCFYLQFIKIDYWQKVWFPELPQKWTGVLNVLNEFPIRRDSEKLTSVVEDIVKKYSSINCKNLKEVLRKKGLISYYPPDSQAKNYIQFWKNQMLSKGINDLMNSRMYTFQTTY